MSASASVELRPADCADLSAIATIYAHHVRVGTASFELEPPDVAEIARRHAAVTAARYPYLVAVDGSGDVLGYAYASAYRSRPGYRYTVEDSIYVAPEATGRGIGRRLLAALIDACTTRGDRQMVAIIGGADNRASIALHARAGFVEVGRLPAVGRKFDRWLDSVLMQRALGDGALTAPAAR